MCALAVSAASLLAMACGDGREPPVTAPAQTAAARETSAAPTATAVSTPPPAADDTLTLLFTGDLIPARCSYARMRETGDYEAAFRPLRDLLAGADVTIGTLDSTLSPASAPIGCIETFNLAGPPEFAAAMKYAGYDVMSHAANHIKDCGAVECGDAAMLGTLDLLSEQGIATAGSGINITAARLPALVDAGGVTFAFLAYDDIAPHNYAGFFNAGSAPLDTATLAADVRAAGTIADVVIVLPHWGIEYTPDPTPRQREIARIAAEAGADLVVGNHPHVVQANERIGDTFVAYALGNFVFDQDWSLETQQGAMLEVTFTGDRVTSTRYLPVHIYDQYQPRLAPPEEAAAILQRIDAATRALAP